MTATIFEGLVRLFASVLQAGGLTVLRHQVDELPTNAAPCIVLQRGGSTNGDAEDIHGGTGDVLTIRVHCIVTGAQWETAADALHHSAHGLLRASAALRSRDIKLTATDPSPSAGDPIVGAIVATYTVSAHSSAALTNTL